MVFHRGRPRLSLLAVITAYLRSPTATEDLHAPYNVSSWATADSAAAAAGAPVSSGICNVSSKEKFLFDIEIVNSVSVGFCLLSALLSLMVVGFYQLMRKRYPALSDRVTLRLAVAVSLADFVFNFAYFISVLPNQENGWYFLCTTSTYILIMAGLASMFLVCSMAFNLLMVFVLNKPAVNSRIERWYYTVSAFAAIGLATVPLASGRLGWTRYECWYIYDENESFLNQLLWEWLTFYLWVAITVLFCTGCCILFWAHLTRRAKKLARAAILSVGSSAIRDEEAGVNAPLRQAASSALDQLKNSPAIPRAAQPRANEGLLTPVMSTILHESSTKLSPPVGARARSLERPQRPMPAKGKAKAGPTKKETRLNRLIAKTVRRVSMYLLVPLAAQAFNIAADIEETLLGCSHFEILLLSSIGAGLQGTLTAIIFFFDPAVARARENLRLDLVDRYVFRYLQTYDLPTSGSEHGSSGSQSSSRPKPWAYQKILHWIVRGSFLRDDDISAMYPRIWRDSGNLTPQKARQAALAMMAAMESNQGASSDGLIQEHPAETAVQFQRQRPGRAQFDIAGIAGSPFVQQQSLPANENTAFLEQQLVQQQPQGGPSWNPIMFPPKRPEYIRVDVIPQDPTPKPTDEVTEPSSTRLWPRLGRRASSRKSSLRAQTPATDLETLSSSVLAFASSFGGKRTPIDERDADVASQAPSSLPSARPSVRPTSKPAQLIMVENIPLSSSPSARGSTDPPSTAARTSGSSSLHPPAPASVDSAFFSNSSTTISPVPPMPNQPTQTPLMAAINTTTEDPGIITVLPTSSTPSTPSPRATRSSFFNTPSRRLTKIHNLALDINRNSSSSSLPNTSPSSGGPPTAPPLSGRASTLSNRTSLFSTIARRGSSTSTGSSAPPPSAAPTTLARQPSDVFAKVLLARMYGLDLERADSVQGTTGNTTPGARSSVSDGGPNEIGMFGVEVVDEPMEMEEGTTGNYEEHTDYLAKF
ncbi:hypothetical protein BJ742DRAFT_776542 [Cladochytrium replicatum]|nr:hypothetical protein BJ742DRAFT_776542 [Cladochytrium replicatum]